MQLTIKIKNKNELLGRTEVSGIVTFDKETPSNIELIEIVAKELKSSGNLVIMKQIKTEFGHKEAKVKALIYDNQETKDKTEKLTKHIKKKLEEVEKKTKQEKEAAEEAKKKEEEDKSAAKEKEKAEKKSESETPAEEKKKETTENKPVKENNKGGEE